MFSKTDVFKTSTVCKFNQAHIFTSVISKKPKTTTAKNDTNPNPIKSNQIHSQSPQQVRQLTVFRHCLSTFGGCCNLQKGHLYPAFSIHPLQIFILSCLQSNLIKNQDFGRGKIWILKRKSGFGGFRRRRFQILGSRNEIREEFKKTILIFSKSNSWPKNSKSKSN